MTRAGGELTVTGLWTAATGQLLFLLLALARDKDATVKSIAVCAQLHKRTPSKA